VSDARILTRPLGGSTLAALATVPDGGLFYPSRPRTPEAWRARIDEIRRRMPDDWLSALAPALDARGPAAERLQRVAREGGIVVTTGQQPGLFGGPVYTWSKALSALTLADALQDATGVPVAPLFWAATDDSDFAEASVTWIATRSGLRELRLPPSTREGVSMAEYPLAGTGKLIDDLAVAAGSAAYDAPFTAVRDAYTRSETVGEAYVRLMRALLEPLGIPVLDAAHAAVRRTAGPLLSLALRESARLDAALAERERAIRNAGHEPQVSHVPGLSLVFQYVDGTRQRVPVSRAADVARAREASLGPNVLLRPILERTLLPTAAYVAGPGELAYFAQVGVLAPILGAPIPLAVPRWSGVIVEPYVDRILERYGITIDELRDRHKLVKRLVSQRVSNAVTAALVAMRDTTHRSIETLRQALADDARPLVDKRVVDGAEGQLMHRIDRLERRVLAAAKRREADVIEHVDAAEAALYPLGRPQERVLNFLPMLAREGPGLLESMRRAARDHAASLVQAPGAVSGAPEERVAPLAT
jgi:bacillithiol biosynthesis cysteine-adding enzyme BshC